jgi:glycolate oxidase FAD binding subunit
MSTAESRRLTTSNVSDARDIAADLAGAVRAATGAREPLRIVGGDTKAAHGRRVESRRLDVAGHRGVTAYDPSELVITARAGTPVAEIEALLTQRGQRLAFEPPILSEASTIGGMVAAGYAGPRRPFAGAVRDSILGVTVLDGRGEALRLGGTVFKNVAGFDGFRLMAGAFGCLGVLLDVSIRVAPIPAAETSCSLEMDWPAARGLITALMRRPLPLDGAAHDGARLHLRLSGAARGVEALAREIGGEATPQGFWDDLRHRRAPIFAAPRLWRLSIPRLARLDDLPGPWLRDWAGGEIWLETDAEAMTVRALATSVEGHATLYRGAAPGEEVFAPLPAGLMALHRRVKAAFDPAGIFNPGRMYEGL